ncbi:MAG: redox-sensing transcriptional repressor Rex [Planctomycetes bacterium]|nr:redox-sensing transcriptional repressor Rex [Planctomycetota bacterium]
MKGQVKIPTDTIKRLFRYYRALLESRETKVVSSEELAKLTGSSAAQIRKDLTYFGEFGTPGKGYNVEELGHQIKGILGIDREWTVALVGIGNLGRALVPYQGLKSEGFRITHLFDSDPKKIGMACAGLKINDINDIKLVLHNTGTKIAILTVPSDPAQQVTNILIDAGIQAILNFAPSRISVPPEIRVLNIDITNELARLSYYITKNINSLAEETTEQDQGTSGGDYY